MPGQARIPTRRYGKRITRSAMCSTAARCPSWRNRMKLLAGLLLLALLPLSGQAPRGLQLKFGTWKLNLQRSKFPPETSPPQSDTRIYEDGGAGMIRSTHTTVNRQGEEALTTYSAKFDGKE